MVLNPLHWFSSVSGHIRNPERTSQQLVFQALLLEYNAIAPQNPPRPTDEGVRRSIDDLVKRGEQSKLSWLELYDFESMLTRIRDDVNLRRSVWGVRREFQQLATEDLWNQYLSIKPPDPSDAGVPIDTVRADVEDLLRKLHELRLGKSQLDIIRAYTTAVALIISTLLIGLLLGTGLWKFHEMYKSPDSAADVSLLQVIAMAGVSGASFSMLIRLGQIPSKGDLVPRYSPYSRIIVWTATPFLSLVEGMMGAFIFYFILRANLVTAGISPSFKGLQDWQGKFPVFAMFHGHIPDTMEAAKLAVWCFLAGFSERLVPDMLSRLSQQADSVSSVPAK